MIVQTCELTCASQLFAINSRMEHVLRYIVNVSSVYSESAVNFFSFSNTYAGNLFLRKIMFFRGTKKNLKK